MSGLKAHVIGDSGSSVRLTWDEVKDSRSKKWNYGIYYGLTLKEMLESKSS